MQVYTQAKIFTNVLMASAPCRPLNSVQVGLYIATQGVIGPGGFSRVKFGYHAVNGTPVAIKIVKKHQGLGMNSGLNLYTHQEIQTLNSINHPNIIKLLYNKETRDKFILVLEYVWGECLSDYIKRDGPLQEEAKRIFYQLAKTVLELHKQGICHQDIKPQNVIYNLITKQLKLLDFRFAHLQREGGLSTSFCGTRFMAPGVIQNEFCNGFATDTWYLEVLFYNLLTNQYSFMYPDRARLLDCIVEGNYEIPPFISKEEQTILKAIFQVNPQQRISLTTLVKALYFKSVKSKLNLKKLMKNIKGKVSAFFKKRKVANVALTVLNLDSSLDLL